MPPGEGFNPRICKRCDDISRTFGFIQPCFNPRICKRCDYETRSINEAGHVSIHASVKDATDSILPKWLTYRVSIHASVKDATIDSFNNPYSVDVSIHASVKDATAQAGYDGGTLMFQSTHL